MRRACTNAVPRLQRIHARTRLEALPLRACSLPHRRRRAPTRRAVPRRRTPAVRARAMHPRDARTIHYTPGDTPVPQRMVLRPGLREHHRQRRGARPRRALARDLRRRRRAGWAPAARVHPAVRAQRRTAAGVHGRRAERAPVLANALALVRHAAAARAQGGAGTHCGGDDARARARDVAAMPRWRRRPRRDRPGPTRWSTAVLLLLVCGIEGLAEEIQEARAMYEEWPPCVFFPCWYRHR